MKDWALPPTTVAAMAANASTTSNSSSVKPDRLAFGAK